MNLVLKLLLVVVLTTIIYYLYKLFYTKNMNSYIQNGRSELKLLDLNVFRIILLFCMIFSLSFISGYEILTVNAKYRKEHNEFVELISEYDRMEFKNDTIGQFYHRYNIYFSGTYYDTNYNVIICITKETPQEAILLLDDANIEYSIVNYNYMELQGVRNAIGNHEKLEGFLGMGINYEINKVVLDVKVGTILPDDLENYVNADLLEINEIEGEIVLT